MAGTVRALLWESRGPDPIPSSGSGSRSGPSALPVVALAPESGLALLPLTGDVVASLAPAADKTPVLGFYDLTNGIAEWARRRSRHGVVAYLHTEYFGGGGFQAAVAWRHGGIVWGPLFTATSAGEAEDHYTVVTGRHDMAVNALLRWLGVPAADQIDEYAAVGLDRHRWTDDWVAESRFR